MAAAGGDADRALALYTWNSRVSASLLRDLADLEVLVRNAYDGAISSRRTGGATHWLTDPSFVLVRPRLNRRGQDANYGTRKIIAKAIADSGGPAAPAGKIVAQLSFGFWRHMTSRGREHEVWVPYLRHAFDAGTSRHDVDSRMERLGQLRNRIAHHEAIVGRDLARDHRELLDLCGWIAADVRTYVASTTGVPALLAARP
jgi:Abi-like protein